MQFCAFSANVGNAALQNSVYKSPHGGGGEEGGGGGEEGGSGGGEGGGEGGE